MGPPGAGKSSVGRSLAQRLNLELRDTDALIEKRIGLTVSEIFLDKGEAFFRECEREIVLEELRTFTGVLALGGGSVLDPISAQALTESGLKY